MVRGVEGGERVGEGAQPADEPLPRGGPVDGREVVARDVDELSLAGLTAGPGQCVNVPRVAEAPVHLECTYIKTTELPGDTPNDVYSVVFGQVVGIHIEDEFITGDGEVDVGKMKPIARLGYQDYAVVNSDTIFTMQRPE